MCLAPVLTTAKEFENGGFTLKMRIMSSTNTAPKDFKKHNNYRSFWICVWGKTLSEKSRDYCEAIVFKQLPCVSRKHENETAGEFKYLWLKERFQKALFLWWISVDGRPINSWNEAAFSNFSVVAWTYLSWREFQHEVRGFIRWQCAHIWRDLKHAVIVPSPRHLRWRHWRLHRHTRGNRALKEWLVKFPAERQGNIPEHNIERINLHSPTLLSPGQTDSPLDAC